MGELDFTTTVPVETDALHALEMRAHEQYALVSSDALRFIARHSSDVSAHIAMLDKVIARAKAQYPKEGDWIVINKERLTSLLS